MLIDGGDGPAHCDRLDVRFAADQRESQRAADEQASSGSVSRTGMVLRCVQNRPTGQARGCVGGAGIRKTPMAQRFSSRPRSTLKSPNHPAETRNQTQDSSGAHTANGIGMVSVGVNPGVRGAPI